MNENLSIFLAGLSAFVFSLVIFEAAPKLLSRISKQYGQLGLAKRVQTNNEFKCIIICIVMGAVGVYVFTFDPEVYPRRVRYNCLLLRHGVAMYLGYTIADVVLMLQHRSLLSGLYLVHHFVGTLCGIAGTVYTSVPWIMSTFLYYEASSPFVHIRVVLLNLGEKNSRLCTATGLVLMAVFFLCRVAIIPAYWRTVYMLYIDGSFPEIDGLVYYLMLYGRVFFDMLNLYWFSLMVRTFLAKFVWPKGATKISD